jgi:hypothetical protein
MPQDIHPAAEPTLRPPENDAASGVWRWLLAAVVVVVILVGAYQAYRWLVSDVERRRAVAVEPAPAPASTPVAMAPPAERTPPPVARAPAPAPPPAAAPNEGPAPAVTGQSIHKCVVDGQVTYSNQPCPDGAISTTLQADTPGTDPNGVAGSAGDSVPAVLVARPASLSVGDPGSQTAVCGYLKAEIERLDFEFKQPLPPAVLDHISSQLASLRARHGEAKCAPLTKPADKKPAAAAPKRPPPKVVEEKRGD